MEIVVSKLKNHFPLAKDADVKKKNFYVCLISMTTVIASLRAQRAWLLGESSSV